MIIEQNELAELKHNINLRRTFAIISHPDAGKTTLTEKLLLYGNAIHLAGNVRARRNQQSVTSDWMAMERERGISVTSTVLQFPYRDHVINLLDTPGHQDFSEDTYRTLMAADSAVMVLDAAKGVEEQTIKLFEVCRRRGIPVFTFINKMDRPVDDLLGLLDEVQEVLGMEPAPMNWPLGDGQTFAGVFDRASGGVHLYDRSFRNETAATETITTLDDPLIRARLNENQLAEFMSNIELLDAMDMNYNQERFIRGEQTPVYFGSALTNFGVQLFLDDFVRYAPSPGAYESSVGPIPPTHPAFSGFVFKIQANMDPKHRDSVAFVRVCSGQFTRGMSLTHTTTGKSIRLARSFKFFADEREIVTDAYAGDIIGVPGNRQLAIGDTLSGGELFHFDRIPRFSPEHFARIISRDISKHKQFWKGLRQLETEGVIQVLQPKYGLTGEPILAVVGRLQFEVVQARMLDEYSVATDLKPMPHQLSRWVNGTEDQITRLPWGENMLRAQDVDGREVAVFATPFYLRYYGETYPDIHFEMIS